jgi:acyl-CoA synthetase (AMP-forming)/AMP-acid ligase II
VIDPEGWFHTGGVGWLDAKGFLTISDRVKDMIISGGEDIYPAEIENVLDQHPGIAEAAVIGLPAADWGETVCAVVALKPGHTWTSGNCKNLPVHNWPATSSASTEDRSVTPAERRGQYS